MAYQIVVTATVEWIGEGVGQMDVASAQSLEVFVTQPVTGGVQGALVTSGNITSACASAGTAIGTLLSNTTNLPIIQGWQTGNP